MNLLFDNDLPPCVPHALRKLAAPEHYVVALRDLYREIARGASVPDERWLREVGARGQWTVITFDRRILRQQATIDAWRESGMNLLVVPRGIRDLEEWDQFAWYVRRFPAIVEFARTMPATVPYGIPFRGSRFKPIPVR